MNDNKLIKVLVAILIAFLAIFGINKINQPAIEKGEKEILLTVFNEKKEEVYSDTIDTDAEMLGQLIDEVNIDENVPLNFELEGDKDSEFGRMVIAVNEITQDQGDLSGYFWVYESQTNEACEEFCPGIDQMPIANQDEIIFKITNEFN